MYELNRMGERVEITDELRVVAADPDDDKFIDCALRANAKLLVSEDKHLIELGRYQSIRMVSAKTFLDIVVGGP